MLFAVALIAEGNDSWRTQTICAATIMTTLCCSGNVDTLHVYSFGESLVYGFRFPRWVSFGFPCASIHRGISSYAVPSPEVKWLGTIMRIARFHIESSIKENTR